MKMIRKAVALLVAMATALLMGIGLASTATAAPAATDPTVPVTGTLSDGTSTVTGTVDVQKFVVQNGALEAIGTFTGAVTDAAGTVTSGTQQVTMPVNLAQTAGSCQILDLVLGPLDLNLLGLQVHLTQVHLNITAQSGPGNLLGNLLCGVAGLLNGGLNLNALLTQITALLNQLLGILG
jgi:hypothetical protein